MYYTLIFSPSILIIRMYFVLQVIFFDGFIKRKLTITNQLLETDIKFYFLGWHLVNYCFLQSSFLQCFLSLLWRWRFDFFCVLIRVLNVLWFYSVFLPYATHIPAVTCPVIHRSVYLRGNYNGMVQCTYTRTWSKTCREAFRQGLSNT